MAKFESTKVYSHYSLIWKESGRYFLTGGSSKQIELWKNPLEEKTENVPIQQYSGHALDVYDLAMYR